MSSGRSDPAAREEEAGEYSQAANDYLAARNFLMKDDLYAKYFDYDLGRARSLHESGDTSGSASLCNVWQRRIFGPLQKFQLSQWRVYGDGLDVERAR
jgi:hypothetical protein